MKDGGWRKALGGVGSWGMAPSPALVGALLKHMQVQSGKEWGEFMEGTAGPVPGCLPTPTTWDLGGSALQQPRGGQCTAPASAAPLGWIWPPCIQGEPRTSRGVSPQTYGLCHGIPPPGSACRQHSRHSFFGKDCNNSLFRLNTTSPGKEQEQGSPFPSPQPHSEWRGCPQGYSPCSGCLQMAFQGSPSSGHSLARQLLPHWRGAAGPHSAGARRLNLLSQEHTSPRPARRYYCAGWDLLSLLLLPESSP